MYQQVAGAGQGAGQATVPVIPYDRNLYLTVTSPDGQDKDLLTSKAATTDSVAVLISTVFPPTEVGLGVLCSAPSVPQPVVQSRRRPLLGPSPG